MQLQLRSVSFQCPHLNDACLFQVVETKHIILNVLSVLNHPCQRVYDIYEIVAFIEHFVNFGATFRELSFESELNDLLNDFWMRLVTHFENVLLVNYFFEPRGCCLQIVQSIPHVTLSCENNCFQPVFRSLEFFCLDDLIQISENFLIVKLGEPYDGTSRLDWFDQLAGVVACQCKSCSGTKFCHDHAEGLLRACG